MDVVHDWRLPPLIETLIPEDIKCVRRGAIAISTASAIWVEMGQGSSFTPGAIRTQRNRVVRTTSPSLRAKKAHFSLKTADFFGAFSRPRMVTGIREITTKSRYYVSTDWPIGPNGVRPEFERLLLFRVCNSPENRWPLFRSVKAETAFGWYPNAFSDTI